MIRRMKTIKIFSLFVLASFLIGFVCVNGIIAVANWQRQIGNQAVIQSVNAEVYQDSACTIPLTHIEWGILIPRSSTSYIGYIKNRGNVPIVLSMDALNWNPIEAGSYIGLTWNLQGISLPVNVVQMANFTLAVSSQIQNITSSTDGEGK